MKAILKSNLSFLFPYIIFIVSGAILIIANNKADTHLEFNSFHNSFFDIFFYYITYLGDGYTAVIIVILLFALKFRYAFSVGLSCLVSAFITQFLKHSVFSDVVRPKKFFEGVHDLYFIPGVNNYLYNSFPSGHSTCVFSLCLGLALIVKDKKIKFLYFCIALLAAYSRVYLSQHFFQDVYAGSIIGVATSIILFYIIQKSKQGWLEKSIVTVFQ